MWACALERGDSSELPHPLPLFPGPRIGLLFKDLAYIRPRRDLTIFSDHVGVQVLPGTSRLSEPSGLPSFRAVSST